MSARWLSGAAGLALSLLLHAAAGGALWYATRPDPVEQQSPPETRLALETREVRESTAAEARPEAQAAREEAPDPTTLGSGAVPTSRAASVAPDETPVTQAAPPSETLAISTPTPETVAAAPPRPEAAPATAPEQSTLSAALPPATSLASTAPAPERAPAAATSPQTLASLAADPVALASATAPTEAATPTRITPDQLSAARARPAVLDAAEVPRAQPAALTLPEPAPLPQAQPEPAVTPEARPAAAQLAESPAQTRQAASPDPDPLPVAPTEGPVTRTRATLAFEGMADLSDPVSVAAVQSFMAPGTLPEGEDVRDGMSALLSGVPCARLQARFRPETGELELFGHVPERNAAAPVLAALRDEMGSDIPVTSNLRVLPRPQCNVLGAVAEVGLPQSTDQITNALLVGEDTHAREFRYAEGDRLVLDLSAPDYDAYLYVDYFDASGQVIHLQPNDTVSLSLAPAKSAQQVGARDAGDRGLSITIGPPYGQELAVAFAASRPLFDETRPLVEEAGPYLDILRERIAAARASDPEFRGEWVYFLVVTRPA